MFRFHCFVHGACGTASGVVFNLYGLKLPSLELTGPPAALPISFDRVVRKLAAIESIHIEPDGSFVWGEGAAPDRWQVDGQLTDGGASLEFVELWGECPEFALNLLLDAFGRTESEVMFQLVKEGLFVDEPTFRKLALANRQA